MRYQDITASGVPGQRHLRRRGRAGALRARGAHQRTALKKGRPGILRLNG